MKRTISAFALTLVVFSGWALLAFAAPAKAIEPAQAAAQLFALTNLDRTSNGLRALPRDNRLSSVAVSRSEDMIARDYFAHEIPPDGKTAVDVLESLGVPFLAAGENIAWNNANDFATVQSAGTDFINSPHHRENLLDPRWDRMGTGVAEGGGKKMYTVLFMETIPPGSATGGAAAPAASSGPRAQVQRLHGEQVELATVRTGLITTLVNEMVRLFLHLN